MECLVTLALNNEKRFIGDGVNVIEEEEESIFQILLLILKIKLKNFGFNFRYK